MLTSDSANKPKKVVFPVNKRGKKRKPFVWRILSLYFVLITTAWLTMWFSQKSINAYWQQTYHSASPFELLDGIPFWRAGESLQSSLNGLYADAKNGFQQTDAGWQAFWTAKPDTHTPAVAATSEAAPPAAASKVAERPRPAIQKAAASEPAVAAASAASAPVQAAAADGATVPLPAGGKVLVAGDSMIQGVAPFLQKWLKSQHHIDSINLSKQSTGLAYPKFFDWPATIEQTFANDKSVKLLVILVGANDPWDFPDPAKNNGIPYLKFQTPEWEKAYLARVNRIVQAADKAGAHIIWLGIPYMKKDKLNEQMRYLDGVLARELNGKKPNVLWLPTDKLYSGDSAAYQDSIMLDGQPTRVRSKDGIHFTARGQQLMSDYIVRHLRVSE